MAGKSWIPACAGITKKWVLKQFSTAPKYKKFSAFVQINNGKWYNLIKRIYEHKEGMIDGFPKKYGCKLLVFYKSYETMGGAILKEKQIKNGSRAKKMPLIETMNPTWKDLYEDII